MDVPSQGITSAQARDHRKERAALYSIFASVVITLGKGVAGLLSGSLALISDAAHSLLDVFATTMTWLAIRAANKPADDEHQYGHGKVESLAALAETAMLFLLAGAVAYEGIRRLYSAQTEVKPGLLAIGVLVAAIIIDGWRWWSLRKTAQETKSEALAADALHFSSDLVNSVLVLAAFGAVMLGYPQADALVAIGVAIFITITGFKLAKRTVDTLIDVAPAGLGDELREIALSVRDVTAIEALRLRVVGATLFGELIISVPRTLAPERILALKSDIAAKILEKHPDSQVTITANPRALDNESALERVLLIAANRRLPVHHVTVQQVGDHLSISLDIELDGRMSLQAAHGIASKLEAAIQDAFGPKTEVETHIEPLDPVELAGSDVAETVRAGIAKTIRDLVQPGDLVHQVHAVRVRDTDKGRVVNLHVKSAPHSTVKEVHDAVDALERAAKKALPELHRIVTHAEPGAPPERG